MMFQERYEISKKYKEDYLEGIQSLIERRENLLGISRKSYMKDIFQNPDQYREDLKRMFGWPLTEERNGLPKVQEEILFQNTEFSVSRMSFEVLEQVRLTGLFFQRNDKKKRPLVVAQHGGAGTPEIIAGIHNEHGFTGNYNDMVERILRYDVDVFAPQLLLWVPEEHQVLFNRQQVDACLRRVGSSITAVELYGLMSILDYFQEERQTEHFGMIGLSYGGFYTLHLAALDTRIESAIVCSYFSDSRGYTFTDWKWENAAAGFNDAEVAALVYPRRLCVEFGDQDTTFAKGAKMPYENTQREVNRLVEMCGECGTEWFDFILFNGNHEFHKDDMPIERLVQDLRTKMS